MATGQKGHIGRTLRTCFRRFRIAVWLLILVLVSSLLYLNRVGLPDVAKRPLLRTLAERGLDLQFSRMRLSWFRGIVAEDVRFGQAGEPLSPQLTLAEVQFRINYRALARLQFQVDSLMLRRGRLVWPIAETSQPPRQLVVDQIQSVLRFLPGDEWALDHFTADFAGAHFDLSGTVANASAVREWKLFQADQAAPVGVWRNRLREFADVLERIHFSAPPHFKLTLRGDARDLASFAIHAMLLTPGADTPWGRLAQGRVNARLFPASTNGLSAAELSLEAAEAHTRWAAATNLQLTAHWASFQSLTNWGIMDLTLCAAHVAAEAGHAADLQATAHLSPLEGQTNLVNGDLTASAASVQTRWAAATNAQLHLQWIHALTNPIPLAADGRLHCSAAATKWAAARDLQLQARLATPPANTPPRADPSWAGWARLEPYALDWSCLLGGVRSYGVEVDQVTCGGQWRAPALTITNLHAELSPQRLEVRAALDVATRALRLSFSSDVDPHRLSPLLTENARPWLSRFAFSKPPILDGEASLVLPAWTNRQPDWHTDVQPTLTVQGHVNLAQGGAYRNVAVSSLQSHVQYSNLLWRLPDLAITRPEGRLDALLQSDDRSHDFFFRIHSTLNVRDLGPLLQPDEQRALDHFTLTEPPLLDAEIWGRWGEVDRTGLQARVALTNFTFRGESVSGFQSALQYTNHVLQFTQPRLQRGAEHLSADAVVADFAAQLVYITNGFSTVEPMVIARAIGPHIARAIEPYQFRHSPVASVWGIVPMHGEDAADLHFDIKEGRDFDWWRFHVPQIKGHVHWLGQHLTLTNVQAALFGGQAHGSAHFDFTPRRQTDYQFTVTTTGSSLQTLVANLFLKTNHLSGNLSGTLVISRANTTSLDTWNGHGDVILRDGLIWDIPLFGMFSSVLNGLVSGLGSSRASAGNCTFAITNGLIYSDDLEIHSTGMRLQYRGTLDFDGRLRARAEAGLLRDTWLIGPVFSTVLWPVTKLFEYKVSGTLDDPKGEPVSIISKVLLLPFQFPFHPIRTLKGLLPDGTTSSTTNSPVFRSLEQN